MGVGCLKQWATIAKEAVGRTFSVTKFFCALHVTNAYVCTPALLQGPSMLPTFNLTGDLILAERISPRFDMLGPGDVVLVRSPENPMKIVTKRLMGTEGDRVTYVVDPKHSDRCQTVVVPKGHVWIEGDNIYDSHDSRNFGPVPFGLIQGKVFWRIWPPESFGSIGHKVEQNDSIL